MSDKLAHEQLRRRARELDIPGRTQMSRDELATAVGIADAAAAQTADATTDTGHRHADAQDGADGPQAPEDDRTVEQLLERARELDVAGRSSMNRDELAAAVAAAEALVGPGSTTPAGADPATAGQVSTAGLVAVQDDPEPATPEQTGRPSLLDLAIARADSRQLARVVGTDPAETQE